MSKTLNQLNEIKKKIIKKAIYHYQIGDLEKELNNLDFDNKKHIQLILKKYKKFENITDETEKLLINQMFVDRNQIPNVKIEPYYMSKEIIKPIKEKEYYIIEEQEEDLFIEKSIEEIITINGIEDLEDEIIEKLIIEEEFEFKFPRLKIPVIPIPKKQLKYYCEICKHNHFYDSKIGKEHQFKFPKLKIPVIIMSESLEIFIKKAYERLEDAKKYLETIRENIKNRRT